MAKQLFIKNSVTKKNMLGDFKLYQTKTKLFHELSASSVSDCLVLVHCMSSPACFLTENARNQNPLQMYRLNVPHNVPLLSLLSTHFTNVQQLNLSIGRYILSFLQHGFHFLIENLKLSI